MGFSEVIMNLRTIFRNIKFCKEDISSFNPDVIIFVDYPGFNMRIAEWAKKKGYPNALLHLTPDLGLEREQDQKDKTRCRRDVCHTPF